MVFSNKSSSLVPPENPFAKTELCKNWPNCRFGELCAFAHGESDLKCKTLNDLQRQGKIPCAQKYKRIPCMNFVSTGACPYKHRCVFLHDPRINDHSYIKSNIRINETPFRSSMSKYDAIQWPSNKQLHDENTFIDIRVSDDTQYTAPDQYATNESIISQSIFFLWSSFVSEIKRQNITKSNGQDRVLEKSLFDEDERQNNNPSTKYFIRRTSSNQVIKSKRLSVLYNLSNATSQISSDNQSFSSNNLSRYSDILPSPCNINSPNFSSLPYENYESYNFNEVQQYPYGPNEAMLNANMSTKQMNGPFFYHHIV